MSNVANIIGVNKRYYPSQDGREVVSCCVLVAGDIGDYAAYVGHGEPEWVADYGDKISFAEADRQFPGGQLSEERYRV